MTLRAKLALVLATLAALAAVGVGYFSYDATNRRMLSEIDTTLRSSKERIDASNPQIPAGSDPPQFPSRPSGSGDTPGAAGYPPDRPLGIEQFVTQQLDATGAVIANGTADVTLPVTARAAEIAISRSGESLETVTGSDGKQYRVYTRSSNRVGTLQIGRDLSEMNRVLSDLRVRLLMIGLAVVSVAAIVGWLLARGLTKSLRNLTEAAAEVSTTGRLDIDVAHGGRDEVGRLGRAFASMLGALNRSRAEQQRLVQDAGHELRTPLTSLRTNVDVLRRHQDMPAEMRSRLLDDLDIEVGELASLVEEVVAVGSGRTSDELPRTFPLGEAACAAADRVGRRTGRQVLVDIDDATLAGQRALVERAITNLLDNAAKFDRSEAPIELTVRAGRVSVRDHGPGIDPGDLDRVFDRFFRAVAARSQPGSGLGLSIVAEVAQAHGGTAWAQNHPDGGAVVGFTLPVAP